MIGGAADDRNVQFRLKNPPCARVLPRKSVSRGSVVVQLQSIKLQTTRRDLQSDPFQPDARCAEAEENKPNIFLLL